MAHGPEVVLLLLFLKRRKLKWRESAWAHKGLAQGQAIKARIGFTSLHAFYHSPRQTERDSEKMYLMVENKRTVYTATTILIQMPHSCPYHLGSYNLPIDAKHFPWHSGAKDSLLGEENRWQPLTNLFCWNILKSTFFPPMFYKNVFFFFKAWHVSISKEHTLCSRHGSNFLNIRFLCFSNFKMKECLLSHTKTITLDFKCVSV